MVNGDEFIKEARRLAQDKEIPDEVSGRLIWALAVDAYHERKVMRKDIRILKTKASMWGATAGLLATVSTILVALFLGVI